MRALEKKLASTAGLLASTMHLLASTTDLLTSITIKLMLRAVALCVHAYLKFKSSGTVVYVPQKQADCKTIQNSLKKVRTS